MQAQRAFDTLVGRAHDDPGIVGLVLSGSRAREGMATDRSDFDVYLVTGPRSRGDGTWVTTRSQQVDQIVMTLEEFRAHALPGTAEEWNRYSFAHAKVMLDRLDGEITRLAAAKGGLAEAEADALARTMLGVYLNSLYRSAKSHRDGRQLESRLDAAETIPPLLGMIFALNRRVRPYNKYLRWELEHHPLSEPEWRSGRLLGRLDRVLATGDVRAQRLLFQDATRIARARGLGAVIDEWGDDLDIVNRLSR